MSESWTVINCQNLNDNFDFLIAKINEIKPKNPNDVLKFKVITENDTNEFCSISLKKLQQKLKNKSIVIFVAAKDERKFLIYWKSKDIRHVLYLSPYRESFGVDDKDVCEFAADFLAESLQNGHLGTNTEHDNQHHKSKIELHSLIDSRNYNLLLLAAESGCTKPIKSFLNYGITTQLSDYFDITAQNLALSGGHHEVLLELLQANLTFPLNIDIDKCNEELLKFIEMSEEFHKMIKHSNKDRVEEIMLNYQNLKYFYNLFNESALKAALDLNMLDVFDVLISNNLSFAPHEDVDRIFKDLGFQILEDVKSIYIKHNKEMPKKYVNIIMENTVIICDEQQDNLSKVDEIYKEFNKDYRLKTILKIVAATKVFKVVFNFCQNSTSDPPGLTHLSHRIEVPAKELFNSDTKFIVYKILARKLCSYAIQIIYNNKFNPYTKLDREAEKRFHKILNACKLNKESEEIIKNVFSNHEKSEQPSELITCPAQLIARYIDHPEKLEEAEANFPRLFEYFKEVIFQMKANLLKIEKEFDNSPCLVFSKLSEKNQIKIKNSLISYENVKVKLSELLPQNPEIYEMLSSSHVVRLLKGEELNFDDQQLWYVMKNVEFKWEKLAGSFRDKILDSEVKFQRENVKLLNFHSLYPEAFNTLTSKMIKSMLKGSGIILECKMDSKGISIQEKVCDFYIDRKFIPEDVKLIYFDYEREKEIYIEYHNELKRNFRDITVNNEMTYEENRQNFQNFQTFQNFYQNFKNQDFENYLKKIKEVKENSNFNSQDYNLNNEKFKFLHNNSDQIIEKVMNDKILILSSDEGSGKTVAFKHLCNEIKKKFPVKWVSYINVNDFVNCLEDDEEFDSIIDEIEKILAKLINPNANLSNFELQIFNESFKSGNCIIFWDNFEEASTQSSQIFLHFIKYIHTNTSNVQLISLNPIYSDKISTFLKIMPMQLLPFNQDNIREFLTKFFISQNIPTNKIEENIQKVEKLFKNFNSNENFMYDSPIMLQILSKTDESGNALDFSQIYRIFDSFITEKIKFFSLDSEIDFIKDFFQSHALLSQFSIFSSTTLGLKLKKLEIFQKSIPEIQKIESLKILIFNGQNKFKFFHKLISEFFVAQYFIENVLEVKSVSVNINEAILRLELFYHLMQNYGNLQQTITEFMSSYLKSRNQLSKKFNPTISIILRSKFKDFLIRMLDTNHPKVFEFLFEFFKSDHGLLVELLHVYEDQTLYTAVFDPNYFGLFVDPREIKELGRKCLTDEEFECFVNGRNHRGKIRFGEYFYSLLGVVKVHEVEDSKFEDTSLVQWQNKGNLGSSEAIDALNIDEQPPDTPTTQPDQDSQASFLSMTIKPSTYWKYLHKLLKPQTFIQKLFTNPQDEPLSEHDQKQLFISSINPKIYLFYDNLFSTADFDEYKKLWTNFENLLNKTELQEVIGNAMISYFEICPDNKEGHEKFLYLLLKKAKKFLTNSKILEIFTSKNILHEAFWDSENFKILWTFLSERTSKDERKQILLQNDEGDKNFYFFSFLNEMKDKFSSHKFVYYYYDFTELKVIHRTMTTGNAPAFECVTKIYEKYLTKSEIQEVILSSTDFLLYLIAKSNENSCQEFVNYLEKMFYESEILLLEFLDRKVEPTNLPVFEFIKDLKELEDSKEKWFVNLEVLHKLYEKLKKNKF